MTPMGAISMVPQSNQRGIETPGTGADPGGDAGLNRTSVGLKLQRITRFDSRDPRASIEPAWD